MSHRCGIILAVLAPATLLATTASAAPQLVIDNFGYDAGGWRVERHPRMLGDVNGDGFEDVVGFGYAGVYVSLSNGDGTFQALQLAVANYGYDAGGWRVERHPRMLGDVNGDGRADIVGFGYAGAYVSLGNLDGTFQAPQLGVANYGYDAGGWRVERHPRMLGDVNDDDWDDIVGFGYAGAYVSLSNGDGTFQAPQLGVANYGYDAGGWRVTRHPRMLGDVNGDGRADIVGFGYAGAYVSLSNGDGTFQAPQLVVANFGYDANAGGWRVERHPRLLGDVNGDGRDDIVGFGYAGVWVSRSNANGTFQAPFLAVSNYGYDPNAGNWRVTRHPRMLGLLNAGNREDIVGFGYAGAYVSLANANGTFRPPRLAVSNFGYDANAGSWRVERHPRLLGDVNGDGRDDIVGFGYAGVWLSINNGNGTFQ